MVSETEIMQKIRSYSPAVKPASPLNMVTERDMQPFMEKRYALGNLILAHVNAFQDKRGINRSQAAEIITENCQQSWDSYKKIITAKQEKGKKAAETRPTLYKFCIGMGLDQQAAEAIFALSKEGPLNPERPEDFLFIKALEDQDGIFLFIEQYERYFDCKISLRERGDNKTQSKKG